MMTDLSPRIIDSKDRVLRMNEVMYITGLSKSSVYRLTADKIEAVPNSISLGGRAVGWLESEVQAWLQSKIDQR